jgi:AAHS family 4-hydroxybenzoate transporter-like MFS transporter
LAFFWLPESLSYLVTKPGREREARRVAAFLRPGLPLADAALRPDVAANAHSTRLADLFAGRLRFATPIMWLIYIASSMTVFSLSSWMPVAVESVGFPRTMAATATAILFAGSAVGGVVGGRCADRFGLSAIIVLALLAIPAVAALGALNGDSGLLLPASFLAGCFAFGGQTCLHGFVGSLYPTPVRANGVGWAIGIAKIGSIAGPFIGGMLLPRLSGSQLFLAAASPLVVVTILALTLRLSMSGGVTPMSVVRVSAE